MTDEGRSRRPSLSYIICGSVGIDLKILADNRNKTAQSKKVVEKHEKILFTKNNFFTIGQPTCTDVKCLQSTDYLCMWATALIRPIALDVRPIG